ncbi:precorrin-4 C(11)-methyltransferase [Phytoactinopolyspora limicola]|uniref:precorrin-4 C(11)-methyltransferase n=1 Tax=Phytoactinopolyspora limicola TaxID=2715536 RepID=UPI00140887A6|nr:precorrin-4 C(11)-methyltransferase [Phytoactinopolyspora limicola]
MTVHFIGAGPGAADLITVRGQTLLGHCQVCLYPGSLTPTELLAHCPDDARLVDTADLTLDQIVDELIAAHERGDDVARLCSGDPSIYSAVAEQMRRLDAAGVPYDVVPGVPAFAAAAAVLGRELTVPTVGQSVILTRTQARSTSMPDGENLATFGASGATLALHLAINRIEQVVDELVPHYGADCPVAVVARASQPGEQVVRGTLGDIVGQVRAAGITRAAMIFVGAVLAAENFPDSFLYSATRDRSKQPASL